MMHYVQTEDGIRNYKVTGVQTCALPIYPQMVENDRIVNIEGPKLGTVKQVGALALFSETPSEISTGAPALGQHQAELQDRKSTRLNSSHLVISYAVFCLKKKKTN